MYRLIWENPHRRLQQAICTAPKAMEPLHAYLGRQVLHSTHRYIVPMIHSILPAEDTDYVQAGQDAEHGSKGGQLTEESPKLGDGPIGIFIEIIQSPPGACAVEQAELAS